MNAAGVFVFTSGEQAAHLRDFKITCVQPDTSTIGNLTNYPVAISATSGGGQPRFILERMAITKFIYGVAMTGNCGGSTLDDVQLSAFNTQVNIDGSLDTVRLQSVHVYPFDLTSNQKTIFYGSTTGIVSGRCDDLVLADCLFLCRNQVVLQMGSDGNATFGSASNCGFDSFIGLTMSAGAFSINGGYFSLDPLAIPSIYQTGGDLRVSDSTFFATLTSDFPIVDFPVQSGVGFLKLTGCSFSVSGDTTCINVTSQGGATGAMAQVTNCSFQKPSNTSYSKAVVAVPSNGRLTMSNCRISDKGTGTGTFIYIPNDDWHRIIGNASTGWSNVFPSAVSGVYLYN